MQIVGVQLAQVDWDEQSNELINKFNLGTLMQGGVGAAYAQTQIAEGFNAAGQNGAGNMTGMAMGVGMMGGMGNLVNPVGTNPAVEQPAAPAQPAQPAQPAAPAPEAPAPEAPAADPNAPKAE